MSTFTFVAYPLMSPRVSVEPVKFHRSACQRVDAFCTFKLWKTKDGFNVNRGEC